jgi:hypothetical protein
VLWTDADDAGIAHMIEVGVEYGRTKPPRAAMLTVLAALVVVLVAGVLVWAWYR